MQFVLAIVIVIAGIAAMVFCLWKGRHRQDFPDDYEVDFEKRHGRDFINRFETDPFDLR